MSRIKKVKKIYWICAATVLAAAVLVSGYFIHTGLKIKTQDPVSSSQIPAQNSNNTAQNASQDKDNYQLIISKINITTQISINADGNNKDEYNKALENGVAHLKGSALPGKSGNVFIFGHSSYYEDRPGNYKQIFAKLNDLVPGDIIEIQSRNARYIYKILDKKIVEPNDVSIANQNYNLKQITLMTCWPVGSTAQRLVVVGELVE